MVMNIVGESVNSGSGVRGSIFYLYFYVNDLNVGLEAVII